MHQRLSFRYALVNRTSESDLVSLLEAIITSGMVGECAAAAAADGLAVVGPDRRLNMDPEAAHGASPAP